MRSKAGLAVMFAFVCTPSLACQLIAPIREPTLPEKIAGLEKIFGGTVVGYETVDGTRLIGSIPPECVDEDGQLDWPNWDELGRPPQCARYLDTNAALFSVDVPIVGPATGEIASYGMHWGDGDCDTDFELGEKWLIAGMFTQELSAPIRDNEIAILQRLAARPPFDFRELYPDLSFDEPMYMTR